MTELTSPPGSGYRSPTSFGEVGHWHPSHARHPYRATILYVTFEIRVLFLYTARYQQIGWARSHLSLSMKFDRTVPHRLPSRAYLLIRPTSQHQIMSWAPKCRATGRGKGPRGPFCIIIRGINTISPARVLTINQRAVLHHHTIQCGKYADRHHAPGTGRSGFPINPYLSHR